MVHQNIFPVKNKRKYFISRFYSIVFGACELTKKQHGHLWKMAFFIDKSQQVAGFHSQNVQDVLIVTKADFVPHNVFFPVLLLLQLEDVAHEELLQLFVGKINAQLLEAVKQDNVSFFFSCESRYTRLEGRVKKCPDLFVLKFSKPKMSSRPMERKEDLGLLANFL